MSLLAAASGAATAAVLAVAVAGAATPVAAPRGPSGPPDGQAGAAVDRMAAEFEVFFSDFDENPGSIYRYLPASGTVDTVYTRPSGRIATFDLYYYPHKLYFVAGSDRKIRRVDYVSGSWQAEQEVFEHGTYVRDIAIRDDSGSPVILFSEASGGGGDGKLYALEYGKAVERYRVRLADVHGYWAGDFSYDASGTLYLSSGNTDGARIYRVTSGTPESVYQTPSGSITGFALGADAATYANNRSTIYRVQLSAGTRTTTHESAVHTGIIDVQTRGDEPALPTATRTATRVPSPTTVPSRTPSPTPSRTASPTPSSTATPTVTASPTASRTPSAPPTAVASATATRTATAIGTGTPTPTATVALTPGSGGRLHGVLLLDGRSDHGGASVFVDGLAVATTDAVGRYLAVGIAPGSHSVDLRHGGYLRAGDRQVTLRADSMVELPPAVLLGGDANGDGAIDIADGGIVAARFGLAAGEMGFDPRADINGDGTVDIHDLVMVGGNFGCHVADGAGRCRRWSEP